MPSLYLLWVLWCTSVYGITFIAPASELFSVEGRKAQKTIWNILRLDDDVTAHSFIQLLSTCRVEFPTEDPWVKSDLSTDLCLNLVTRFGKLSWLHDLVFPLRLVHRHTDLYKNLDLAHYSPTFIEFDKEREVPEELFPLLEKLNTHPEQCGNEHTGWLSGKYGNFWKTIFNTDIEDSDDVFLKDDCNWRLITSVFKPSVFKLSFYKSLSTSRNYFHAAIGRIAYLPMEPCIPDYYMIKFWILRHRLSIKRELFWLSAHLLFFMLCKIDPPRYLVFSEIHSLSRLDPQMTILCPWLIRRILFFAFRMDGGKLRDYSHIRKLYQFYGTGDMHYSLWKWSSPFLTNVWLDLLPNPTTAVEYPVHAMDFNQLFTWWSDYSDINTVIRVDSPRFKWPTILRRLDGESILCPTLEDFLRCASEMVLEETMLISIEAGARIEFNTKRQFHEAEAKFIARLMLINFVHRGTFGLGPPSQIYWVIDERSLLFQSRLYSILLESKIFDFFDRESSLRLYEISTAVFPKRSWMSTNQNILRLKKFIHCGHLKTLMHVFAIVTCFLLFKSFCDITLHINI